MKKTNEVFIPTKWRARISKDNIIELKFFVQNNRTLNVNLTMNQLKQITQIFREILGVQKNN
jgi:hypothetical protein